MNITATRSIFKKAAFVYLAIVVSSVSVAVTVDGKTEPRLVRGASYDKTELLVKFRSTTTAAQIQSLAGVNGIDQVQQFGSVNRRHAGPIDQWRLVKLAAGTEVARARADLLRSGQVELVEYNYEVKAMLTPNDPSFSNLWGLHNIGQTGGTVNADVNGPEAWDQQTDGRTVVVAVVDTGIAYDHPDLAANMWVNPGEIPNNGIDDEGNGYTDDVHGYNFVTNTGNPYDDHGHGTHVAGTIGAVGNNGVGVVGVNWNARIMAVKFLDSSGSGSVANAINAILYASNNGAKVLNNSWGGGGFSQALLDAINSSNQAGAIFVASAGNSANNNDINPAYPASYNAPNIISVAATDHLDSMASFSNYGLKTVHLGAPGVFIYSTTPFTGNVCCSDPTGYKLLNGTSMAAPQVSGAATLLFSRFPGINLHQVRDRLLASTDSIAALLGKTVTGGRLNVASAMVSDTIAPAPVIDLAPLSVSTNTAALRWTATGDDAATGTASSYELRYSTGLIDEKTFASATLVSDTPKPSGSGTVESFTVSGLMPNTNYYFALRVKDKVGNSSALSNVLLVRTKAVKVIFNDSMETSTTQWTVAGSDGVSGPALWHISPHRFSSATTAMYYGKESTLNYNTGTRNFGSITSIPISLVGQTEARLSFSYFLQKEDAVNFDVAKVQVSTDDGASWIDIVASLPATPTGMMSRSYNLSAYDGQTIRVRFNFDTMDADFNAFEGFVVDDVVVTVANIAPVAKAGPDQTVSRGKKVTLNGTGSRDLDGTIVSYHWRQVSGPTVRLTNVNSAIINFRAPDVKKPPVSLTFELKVTDNRGASATDRVVITVTK